MDLGFQEILLILVLALLVYGGDLPKVARSLGRMVAGLKKAFMEGADQMKTTVGVDEITRDVDLRGSLEESEPEGGVRTVRRVPFPTDAPAPPEVAQEDVSGETLPAETLPGPAAATPAASPAASASSGPGAPGGATSAPTDRGP